MIRKCVVIFAYHATYVVNFLAKAASEEFNIFVVAPREIPYDHVNGWKAEKKDWA